MEGFELFSSISVIALAAITHATLQMELGTLLLLYHSSLGKHLKKKTKWLVTNYIFGALFLITLSLAAACFAISVITNGTLPVEIMIIITGIMVALAVCIWFFYYRSGRSTELWLPKSVARYINRRANLTESNVESFGLGMLATLAEAPFSLILIIVAANNILSLPGIWQVYAVLAYAIVAVMPTIIMRFAIRHGRTVVDVQKWRIKNKNFFKILSGVSFAVLALFILSFKIMGN